MSLCVEASARMCGKFEGVLEMHRVYPVDTVEYLTEPSMASKVIATRMAF